MLNPVSEPIPIETKDPIPAASKPGSRTNGNLWRSNPKASIKMTAAMIGWLKIIDIAAKLPDAAMTACTSEGVSLRTERIATRPRPAPNAIKGASGPRTRPRPIVANPASAIPGNSVGSVGPPPTCRPFAGTWPPAPGKRTIAKAMITPAIPSTARYHQSGGPC